jgi:hypothetical protein
MIYLLLQSVIVYAYEFLLFNSLNAALSTTVSLLVSFVLLCGIFSINLHIATNLTNGQRWKFAVVIASVLLFVSIFPEVIEQTEFSESPDYVIELLPPATRVTRGNTLDGFLEESLRLFDATDLDD